MARVTLKLDRHDFFGTGNTQSQDQRPRKLTTVKFPSGNTYSPLRFPPLQHLELVHLQMVLQRSVASSDVECRPPRSVRYWKYPAARPATPKIDHCEIPQWKYV